MISRRSATLGGSKTTAARIRAEQLRASGTQIANLSAGELDLMPPAALTHAIGQVAGADVHRYTPTGGTAGVRSLVAEYVAHTRHIPMDSSKVVMTTGAKHGLFEVLYCLTEPGDEVLIPTPAWGTFINQVKILGAHAVTVTVDPPTFTPTIAMLEKLRTARTRAIVLNSPHNPTGTVYPDELLAEIAEWARRYDIAVVLDESYIDIYYTDQRPMHVCRIDSNASANVVTVGSFSKALAITGWRSGYVHGPDNVIKAVAALQSHIISNPTSLCQSALETLTVDDIEKYTRSVRDTLRNRRDLVTSILKSVDTLDVTIPMGAFYFYVNARTYLDEHGGSVDELADQLLEHGVSVTPGSAFGSSTHFRLSYAIDIDQLKEGVYSIAAALQS